jgi:hypothetical protein
MQRYDDYPKINSFADAEKRYAEIKVLRSKNHPVEQDVRPLGTRTRKWERIKKLSDDCYVMLDGCVHTDDIWNGRYERPHELVTLNTTFAPIIWTRKGETESIRIRNGIGNWAHNSRYTFFENWLPMGLEFQIDSGRQYIVASHNRSERYYLPKTMHGSVWHGHGITPKVDDGHYLTFTRYTPYHPIGDSSWKPQGDTFEYAHPKQVVDKEAKKKLKPYIDSMWEYITTMYNVLDIKRALVIGGYDWQAARERRDHNRDYYSRVKSEDKDDKLSFAVNFLTEEKCTDFTVTTEEDRKLLRSIYNRWVNKELNLTTTIPSQVVRRKEE